MCTSVFPLNGTCAALKRIHRNQAHIKQIPLSVFAFSREMKRAEKSIGLCRVLRSQRPLQFKAIKQEP